MHTQTHAGVHVKCSLFFTILTKSKVAHHFLINVSYLTFNKNNAAVNELLQAQKQTDINKHTAGIKVCLKSIDKIQNHQKPEHKYIKTNKSECK
jgi:hypothetical protein